jgi:hypothetical protein
MEKIYKYPCLLLSFLLSLSPLSYGQKLEIEKRIEQGEFPKKALQYLEEEFGLEHRMKWYEERCGDEKSFEAKFIRDGKKYSI